MPPFCTVCNKDLSTDSGSDGKMCRTHLVEDRQRKLHSKVLRITFESGGIAILRLSAERPNRVWVTLDLADGRREFARYSVTDLTEKYAVDYVADTSDTFIFANLTDEIVESIRDAIVVGLDSGYRYLVYPGIPEDWYPGKEIVDGRENTMFTANGNRMYLYKLDDWSEYEELDLTHPDEYYISKIKRQFENVLHGRKS